MDVVEANGPANWLEKLTARADQKRRLEYERWRVRWTSRGNEFERHAATITHISPEIQIQFKEFEVIDHSAWENIRSGIGASKTWFFQLVFRKK